MTDTKNDQILNKRAQQIIESTIKTINDPDDPGARKSDCYAQCALYIKETGRSDCEIAIFGTPDGEPMHGIVLNEKGDVLKDTFSSYRQSLTENSQKAHYEKGQQSFQIERVATITPKMWQSFQYKDEIEMPDMNGFDMNIEKPSQNERIKFDFKKSRP